MTNLCYWEGRQIESDRKTKEMKGMNSKIEREDGDRVRTIGWRGAEIKKNEVWEGWWVEDRD